MLLDFLDINVCVRAPAEKLKKKQRTETFTGKTQMYHISCKLRVQKRLFLGFGVFDLSPLLGLDGRKIGFYLKKKKIQNKVFLKRVFFSSLLHASHDVY